jgi:hypothetical protein
MSWGARRRLIYILIILTLFGVPLALVAVKTAYRPATCFDNTQNQNEAGVDCGGSCALLCTDQTLDPIVQWQRIFRIADGLYTVAVLVENPNAEARADDLAYVIRVYDEDGVAMYDRRGAVSLDAKEIVPIVEPGIPTNERTPSRITFDFVREPVWTRDDPKLLPIAIRDIVQTNLSDRPTITARLVNSDIEPVEDFGVAVIVYGTSGNAIAASKTLIDSVPAGGETQAIFTWPRPLDESILRVDIVPEL